MLLIKNAELYAPEYLGVKDLLIAGGRIERIADSIEIDCEIVDAAGKIVVPGFIDQHVHVIGGGGEGGFQTRTPEIQLGELVAAGITSVVGLLGTDGWARDMESLLAKIKALKEEGLSAYACTGSYAVPSVTLTGSAAKDIMFIDEVLGLKLALSDHRSSHITLEELIRIASEVRTASMLGKKPGMITLHMGSEKAGLSLLREITTTADIPVSLFRPTHVTRSQELFEEAKEWQKHGGWIDLTAGNDTAESVLELLQEDSTLSRVTLSSDGQGSWSHYDQTGRCTEIGVSSVSALTDAWRSMILKGIDMQTALKLVTSNVAEGLGLLQKGRLEEGRDADVLIFDQQYVLSDVFAKGKRMMKAGVRLVKGTFEK